MSTMSRLLSTIAGRRAGGDGEEGPSRRRLDPDSREEERHSLRLSEGSEGNGGPAEGMTNDLHDLIVAVLKTGRRVVELLAPAASGEDRRTA